MPIPTLIERHAQFRKLCFDSGLRIDYTDYDPDLFIDKCLRDDTSWLHSLSRWLREGVEHEKCRSPLGDTYYVPVIRHLDFFCWIFADRCETIQPQYIHDMLDPAFPEFKRGKEATFLGAPAQYFNDPVADALWMYGHKFDIYWNPN